MNIISGPSSINRESRSNLKRIFVSFEMKIADVDIVLVTDIGIVAYFDRNDAEEPLFPSKTILLY